MLQSLSIKNFILIDEVNIEFNNGLCVITGETGAGKSILLKALIFCLNAKQADNIVKKGTDFCSVTAVFTLSDNIKNLLSQFQINYEDELIIKRTQTSDNRRKFLINDQIVTAKTITQITEHLFELHGQNTHTSLLKPSSHISILDDYGNLEDIRKLAAGKYDELQNIEGQISELLNKQNDIEKEIEYLQFATDELSKANIQIGEEEKLTDLRRRLQNRDKELQLFNELLSLLETPAIYQTISRALRTTNRINKDDQRLNGIDQYLNEAYNNLEQAADQLKNIIKDISNNEYNLDEIEERLFTIKGLARKYSVLADHLPELLIAEQQKLSKLQQKIIDIDQLHSNQKRIKDDYFRLAEKLSIKRKEIALELEGKIHNELIKLQMDRVVFKVNITKSDGITSQGVDIVQFIASTNPGIPPAAIDKIASGGELARFMLALKSALVGKAATPLVIFDEIDTGVSGMVADSIGDRLKQLASTSQVLVITHQPQVAAKANQHLLVSKTQFTEHTKISVCTLDEDGRNNALAQMIAGKIITDNSIRAAKDLRL